MKIKLIGFILIVCHTGFAQINMTGLEDKIVLDNFEFRHPMTVISAEELAIVKDRIEKGIEPQATAFNALIEAADSQQHFIPDAPTTMQIDGGYTGGNLQEMRAWLGREASAAYTSALAFSYTGETKYATKAIEILNTWANQGTTFTGDGRFLQLGGWFTPMLYAADLLYDYEGWDIVDKSVFKEWWRKHVLVHTHEALYKYLNNQKDAGMLGVMAAAIVLEDSDLLQECLNEFLSYFQINPAETNHPRQWKIYSDHNGVYLTREVNRSGGRNGLVYTSLAMTAIVQNMEMARYAGYNFWTAKTLTGGDFQGVIEQLFKWSILKETYPWHSNPAIRTYQKNMFEIANNNSLLPASIKYWLTISRPVEGIQGDEFVTLNKGDIFNHTSTGMTKVKTNNLHVYRLYDGVMNIKLKNADTIEAIIYNKLGVNLKRILLSDGDNLVTLPTKDLYIVKVGSNVFKVLL